MIDWGVILLEKIRCLSLLWVKGQIEGVPGCSLTNVHFVTEWKRFCENAWSLSLKFWAQHTYPGQGLTWELFLGNAEVSKNRQINIFPS